MARRARAAVGGVIYHVLNRGNCRMPLFEKPADYTAFIKLLEQARQRARMRILGYCLMNNHWHLVLWPREDGDLSAFMQWLTTTHVRRWREHRDNVGEGHLYQGRYKSFPIQDDEHLLTVLRYVEANPLRATLVQRAEQWPFSSLRGSGAVKLEVGPVERPDGWERIVNRELEESEVEPVRLCIKRNRPYGAARWVAKIANRLGMESSLRDPWRPVLKAPAPKANKQGCPPY